MAFPSFFEPDRPVQLISDVKLPNEELLNQRNIVDSIFSINEENQQSVIEKVSKYVERNKEDARFIYDVIMRATIIREEKIEIYLNLFGQLSKIAPSHMENIEALEKAKTKNYFAYVAKKPINPRFINLLGYHKIIPYSYVENLKENKKLDEEGLLYEYPKESLEYYIRNDDIERFKTCVESLPNFDFNQKIDFSDTIKDTIQSDVSSLHSFFQNTSHSLLNFAAYYGSLKTFKYFILNDCHFDEFVTLMAVHGSNFEILHILENDDNVKYSEECFELAVMNYRNDIADWLLLHFSCSIPKLISIIPSYNYDAIFFVHLNTYILKQTQLLNSVQSNAQQEIQLSTNSYNTSDFAVNIASLLGMTPYLIYLFNEFNINEYIQTNVRKNNQNRLKNELICSAVESGVLSTAKFIMEQFSTSSKDIVRLNRNNKKTKQIAYYGILSKSFPIFEEVINYGFDCYAQQTFEEDGEANFYPWICQECTNREIFSTTAHLIADIGADDILDFHLEHCSCQIDYDIHDARKRTPLHIACMRGNYSMVQKLIEAGANYKSEDEACRTSLHYAALGGNTDIIQLLLSKGLDVNLIPKYHDRSPLHIAAEFGRLEACKVLLLHGADVNSITPVHHETPLYLAAMSGHTEVVELLIHSGANLEIKDYFYRMRCEDQTPLLVATQNGYIDIIKLLVENKANINSTCYVKNRTPLHLAAMYCNKGIVQYLVSKGADKTAVDDDGCTPYDLAKSIAVKALLN